MVLAPGPAEAVMALAIMPVASPKRSTMQFLIVTTEVPPSKTASFVALVWKILIPSMFTVFAPEMVILESEITASANLMPFPVVPILGP